MNSIPRLRRTMYLDHATPKDRLIFTERRRPWWKNRMVWYPVVFFSLWLLYAVATAEPVMGETDKASYWCIRDYQQIVYFCATFTHERR